MTKRDLSSVTKYVPSFKVLSLKVDNPLQTGFDRKSCFSLTFATFLVLLPARPYAFYFENRMITRLRYRFPATCSRSEKVEGEYILSGEGPKALRRQRSCSRVSHLGCRDERGRFKDEEDSILKKRFYYVAGCVGGPMLVVYYISYSVVVWSGCIERFRVGIIRIRNLFLPHGSTATSFYILTRFPPPFRDSLDLPSHRALTRCKSHFQRAPRIKSSVKYLVDGYVIFLGFMTLSR